MVSSWSNGAQRVDIKGVAVGKAFGIPFRIPFGGYFFLLWEDSLWDSLWEVFSNGSIWRGGAQRLDT